MNECVSTWLREQEGQIFLDDIRKIHAEFQKTWTGDETFSNQMFQGMGHAILDNVHMNFSQLSIAENF